LNEIVLEPHEKGYNLLVISRRKAIVRGINPRRMERQQKTRHKVLLIGSKKKRKKETIRQEGQAFFMPPKKKGNGETRRFV
jgi:hypothetical protein